MPPMLQFLMLFSPLPIRYGISDDSTGTNITLKIATTAGNETVNIGTIEAGKAYTINLTFKQRYYLQGDSTDWTDGGTAGHDVK